MSYRVNREKKLGDDAENNTGVDSAGTNNSTELTDLILRLVSTGSNSSTNDNSSTKCCVSIVSVVLLKSPKHQKPKKFETSRNSKASQILNSQLVHCTMLSRNAPQINDRDDLYTRG